MAEDDIYNNEARYQKFLRRLDDRALPPEEYSKAHGRKYKYRIRNPANLEYFRKLVPIFEANDLSFIHRLRQFQHLLIVAHSYPKDFAELTREDMNGVMTFMHTCYKAAKSKRDFVKYIKRVWKMLFPVRDEHGYIDENAFPYPVRHLSTKIDKSKKKLRNDRLTWEEFTKILNFFGDDSRMQAYIMLATESLGRPQEILTRKIKHVELHNNYAKVWLTDHGKEGPGLLQCLDSFPYLAKWLQEHPMKEEPEAYLFVNRYSWIGEQMTTHSVNANLRQALETLGIKKKLTAYSLKRNGVTFRRLRGESDLEIQHAARWTTSRQLDTYDLTVQEDAFQKRLIERGLLQPKGGEKHLQQDTQACRYCGATCGFADKICDNCKRPLNREDIVDGIMENEQLKEDFEMMRNVFEKLKDHLPPHILESLAAPEINGGG